MPMSSAEVLDQVLAIARAQLVPSRMTAAAFDDVVSPRVAGWQRQLQLIATALPWGGFVSRDEQPMWLEREVSHPAHGLGLVLAIKRAGARADVIFGVGDEAISVRAQDLALAEPPTPEMIASLETWAKKYDELEVKGRRNPGPDHNLKVARLLQALQAWPHAIEGAPIEDVEWALDILQRHIPRSSVRAALIAACERRIAKLQQAPNYDESRLYRVIRTGNTWMVHRKGGVGRVWVAQEIGERRLAPLVPSGEGWVRGKAWATGPLEGRHFLGTFEPVGAPGPPADERPPKFQPYFVAYARALGREPAELAKNGRNHEFMAWIRQRWQEWRRLNRLPSDSPLTSEQQAQFAAWLREEPEGPLEPPLEPRSEAPEGPLEPPSPPAPATRGEAPGGPPEPPGPPGPAATLDEAPGGPLELPADVLASVWRDPCPECGVDPVVRATKPASSGSPSSGFVYVCSACERPVRGNSRRQGFELAPMFRNEPDLASWQAGVAWALRDEVIPADTTLLNVATDLARAALAERDGVRAAVALADEFRLAAKIQPMLEALRGGRAQTEVPTLGVTKWVHTISTPKQLNLRGKFYLLREHETFLVGERVSVAYAAERSRLRIYIREPNIRGLCEVRAVLDGQVAAPWFKRNREIEKITGEEIEASLTPQSPPIYATAAKRSKPVAVVQIEARQLRASGPDSAETGEDMCWAVLVNGLEYEVLPPLVDPTVTARRLLQETRIDVVVRRLRAEMQPLISRPLAPSERRTALRVLPKLELIEAAWGIRREYDVARQPGPRTWDIVWVGCGKEKRKTGKWPAEQIYTGSVFKAHMAIACHMYGRQCAHDILSAKHGPTPLRQELTWYDQNLDDDAYWGEWSAMVLGHVTRFIEDKTKRKRSEPVAILALAGARYIDGWAPEARRLGVLVDEPLQGLPAGTRRQFADRLRRETPGRDLSDCEPFDFTPREQLLDFAAKFQGSGDGE